MVSHEVTKPSRRGLVVRILRVLLPNNSIIERDANFRRLFLGESVSYFGTNVSTVVLPLVAVLSLHASVLQMGVLGALQFAPYLLLSPFAGIAADRHRRRRIGVIANAGRAVMLGSIAVLAIIGLLSMFSLYVIALLVSSLGVFFDAAFWPFIRTLVQESDLVDANSKLISTQSAATMVGPGIGGILVEAFTAPVAMLANAASYLFSTLQLVRIQVAEETQDVDGRATSLGRELSRGFHVIFRSRVLLGLLGEMTTYNMFFQMIIAIFFVYTVRQLEMSTFWIGAALSFGGVGALAGATLVPRIAARVAVGRMLLSAMFVGNSAWLMLALLHTPGALDFPILALMFLLDGFGSGVANVLTISIRQTAIPKDILGSGMASGRTIGYGIAPMGALLGGVLGSTMGLWPTLVVGAVGIFASSFWVLFSPVPRIRTLTT